MNFNKGNIKVDIFVINLEQRNDRLAHMSASLSDIGANWTRISGVESPYHKIGSGGTFIFADSESSGCAVGSPVIPEGCEAVLEDHHVDARHASQL